MHIYLKVFFFFIDTAGNKLERFAFQAFSVRFSIFQLGLGAYPRREH
jgi:hypothetical protein